MCLGCRGSGMWGPTACLHSSRFNRCQSMWKRGRGTATLQTWTNSLHEMTISLCGWVNVLKYCTVDYKPARCSMPRDLTQHILSLSLSDNLGDILYSTILLTYCTVHTTTVGQGAGNRMLTGSVPPLADRAVSFLRDTLSWLPRRNCSGDRCGRGVVSCVVHVSVAAAAAAVRLGYGGEEG